jgi:predicted ABC-type ATPase
MSAQVPPVCRIVAGPNGAGKTTFALAYLPGVAPDSAFVNADLIAAGLSPLAPERQLVAASKLFLGEIERSIRAGQDFAFETTLAGRGYLRLIERLRQDNWRVELLYLALPSVEMSRLRVEERVRHGGHAIPREAIERRFSRSLRNLFDYYAPAATSTDCFMNTGAVPELVFSEHDGRRGIHHPRFFQLLTDQAKR